MIGLPCGGPRKVLRYCCLVLPDGFRLPLPFFTGREPANRRSGGSALRLGCSCRRRALLGRGGRLAAGLAGGGLFDSVRTLSVHMYVLSSEGLHIDKTYATAVVLLVIVIGINALSSFVAKKITKKQG